MPNAPSTGAPTEHTSLLVASSSPRASPSRHCRTASHEASGSEGETDEESPAEMSLEAGSILSSVVNLCTATLGAGCLSLPWAMAQSGLLGGLLLLAVAAWASDFTVRLLVRLYATGERISFESLSLRAFGRVGSAVTHIAVLLFCFGAAVASIMVVGDILEPVFRILLPNAHALHHKSLIAPLLTVLIMLPLSCLTRISSMRVMSLVSTGGVLCLAFVFLLEGGSAAFNNSFHHVRLFRFDSGLLLALPVIMFAYSCQTNIFSILEEQRDQRRATDFKMVNMSIGVETFVYVVIGTLGYLLYGGDVDGNVLRNMNLHSPLHIFAQAAIGLSLCLSYPLCIYPARFTLQDTLWPGASTDSSEQSPFSPKTLSLTLGLVFSSLAFAILVPSISELFTLLGSTTGALIAFILPTAMYLQLGEDREKQRVRRIICRVMLVTSIIIAIATTGRSLMYIVETKEHDLRKEPESADHKHRHQ